MKRYLIPILMILILSLGLVSCGQSTRPGYPPNGTYTAASAFALGSSIIIEGTNMEVVNFMGRQKVSYELVPGQGKVILTDLVTKQKKTFSFKYIKEAEAIVFDGVTYYKK